MVKETKENHEEKKLCVKFERGYQSLGNEWFEKDAEVSLPAAEAKDVIDKGIAIRNDPLPA